MCYRIKWLKKRVGGRMACMCRVLLFEIHIAWLCFHTDAHICNDR
jgi:hypothetical protein